MGGFRWTVAMNSSGVRLRDAQWSSSRPPLAWRLHAAESTKHRAASSQLLSHGCNGGVHLPARAAVDVGVPLSCHGGWYRLVQATSSGWFHMSLLRGESGVGERAGIAEQSFTLILTAADRAHRRPDPAED